MVFKKKSGFTLIELIVVIAILAILAGVGTAAYTGYVNKANEAADNQLLAFVNKAFASACAANGVDVNDSTKVNAGNAKLTIDSATKLLTHGETDLVNKIITDSFDIYMEGNTAKFKVFTALKFQNGVFVNADGSAYADLVFAQELIDKVKLSAFFTAEGLGVNNLLDKVNSVSYEAAKYASDGSEGATQMLAEYYDDLMADLGFTKPFDEMTSDEQRACMEAIEKMNLEKQAILATQIPIWDSIEDPEDKKLIANNAILSSYAVLDAAKGMSGKSVDMVLADIQGETSFKTLILNSTNKDGVATASAAYGLYTAYAYSLPSDTPEQEVVRNEAIAKTQDPSALLDNMMSDAGFVNYLNDPNSSVKTDLEGYLAAMQMIDASSSNKDAVRSLIVNGFADPALVAVIQQQVK